MYDFRDGIQHYVHYTYYFLNKTSDLHFPHTLQTFLHYFPLFSTTFPFPNLQSKYVMHTSSSAKYLSSIFHHFPHFPHTLQTSFHYFPSLSTTFPHSQTCKASISFVLAIQHLSSTLHHFPTFSTPYKHPSLTFHRFPPISISTQNTLCILVVQQNIYPPPSITFLSFTNTITILHTLVAKLSIYSTLSTTFLHSTNPTNMIYILLVYC